jgi:hypothetical protein
MKILIKFTDGTEQREYSDESPTVRNGLLIISKGRYSPPLFINLQTVKSFQEEER